MRRRYRIALAVSTAGTAIGVCLVAGLSAASSPLADLKAGSNALDARRYTAAVPLLQPVVKRLPKLADYAAWFLASAQFNLGKYTEVPAALDPVWKQTPPSPLASRAYLLASQAYGKSGAFQQAVNILRDHYRALPQPSGDLALASAFDAAGDQVSAVVYYQRVYYGFPSSPQAAQAGTELERLKTVLGDNYPPSMPNSMLSRALKLLEAGDTKKARTELEALVPQLGGADRDLARVSIGVADYEGKDTAPAQRYLSSLEVSAPDADAERLYYLLLCARRLGSDDGVKDTLDRLGRLYPDSHWRLQALVATANSYLTQNQSDAYEPLYRACYESFPRDPQAATCHWKVTWSHYLRRSGDAAGLLREHLRLFPGSESASGALYFLARLAEAAHQPGAARAYYDQIEREYPNYYYAALARQRLDEIHTVATPSSAVRAFLEDIAFPERVHSKSFQPDAMTAARIERARLLASIGLEDWAEGELRFGAQTGDQPHVLAEELATLTGHATPDQALRYIKRYAGGYLFMPLDSAPDRFWKLAFPMPYRTDLERYSKRNGLDPFLVAALIRQESEFNTKAVSRANARGLTQILPSTGRELSRRLKLRPYSTARLFQPALNLELGTYYLKSMTAQLDGNVAAALAAYNAGLSRAQSWLSWADFREPAEFVETIPFTQTRTYIQTVLRNADVYRRIYADPQERAAADQ
jgi:soluble lytic murein transglycosylase